MITITYIAAAVILLGLCIFVHELGHLLGGRMVGIKAKVFSLGYGKGILKKKIGDTTYQVTLIPFGGYCQFYGEEPGEERTGKEYEFLSAHPLKRIVTVAMGPLFNLFFGVILFFSMNIIGYTEETNRIYIPEQFRYKKYMSAAYKAGIRDGDEIIKINGKKISGFSDIQTGVIFSEGKELNISVKRGEKIHNFSVTPNIYKGNDRYSIGVAPHGNRLLIAGVLEGDVAEKSGIRQLDEIKSINGKEIKNTTEFTDYIKKHSGKKLSFTIIRKGNIENIYVVPRMNEFIYIREVNNKSEIINKISIDKGFIKKAIKKGKIKIKGNIIKSYEDFHANINRNIGRAVEFENDGIRYNGIIDIEKRGFIGVYPAISPDMKEVKYGIVDAAARAFIEPYEFIVLNIRGMGMLFAGKMNVRKNLSGPIRIAKIAGDVAYYKGLSAFIILMAKISIILMVMNFLPIPVVDGGHLMFFLYEIIRGKPINEKVMARIQAVGIIILIMLGVFVIVNDISMLPIIQRLFN